jgi:alkylation response protein AidB-like acyl-CoA dehydrogenase
MSTDTGIGLDEDHSALAESVRGLAARRVPPTAVRAVVDAKREARPDYWADIAAQGLLGTHLPERFGGQGFGLVELAIAVEELGRALAPGPYVPTVLASAAILTSASDAARKELLPSLADGSRTAALALPTTPWRPNRRPTLPGRLAGRWDGPDRLVIAGVAEPVLGAGLADVLVLPVVTDRGEEWVAADAGAPGLTVSALDSLDLTRRVYRVEADGLAVGGARVLDGLTGEDVRNLAAVVLGAEACGVAGWCVRTAAEYAKIREQFGRPIGQFQGVKHKCAAMLVALEQARALVWDAATRAASRTGPDAAGGPGGGSGGGGSGGGKSEHLAYAAAAAAFMAPDAAIDCARDCIQVLGGIGYTWEHDAHLYYRRALTLRGLLGRATDWASALGELAIAGVRPQVRLTLPAGSEPERERIRDGVAELAALPPAERVAAMADGGWVMPHLPRPWGQDAGPLEQVLIHEELKAAGVRPPALMIGAWAVPTIVRDGTREQRERFIGPTLRGEIIWCQLFSEPGAGSDLASVQMKAERVEAGDGGGSGPGGGTGGRSGWRLTGQKIWTSLAREAHWAICIARTDPDAPKHDGITYFLVDMSDPGIDVRPLKEITGDSFFNEVFLDGVFVPDELVVGEVNRGWQVARNTLANERVSLATSWSIGADLTELVELVKELDLADDPVVGGEVGRFAADAHAFELLGMRVTLRQLSGTEPGPTSSVRKLLGMRHGQELTEYGWTLLGGEGVLWGEWSDERRRKWMKWLFATRSGTIGGGTTQVQLNIIGERMLGLPRDPQA